jgi:hypothetical protein
MTRILSLLIVISAFSIGCEQKPSALVAATSIKDAIKAGSAVNPIQDSGIRAIHVFVALCDNKYQGIVPVPATIGNGQDPARNLYWGAGYGVKTYFKKSSEWKLVASRSNPVVNILERLLFKHVTKDIYLLADAYDGKFIRQATIDFLQSASGQSVVHEKHGDKTIYFGGKSHLVAYIGHDGLMDFSIDQVFEKKGKQSIDAIILACYSKSFFSKHLRSTGATPLLWTSGLMAPEAYTLHDAIHEWVNKNSPRSVRIAAAKAYSKYQKCSLKAAQNLLVQGW